MTNKTWQEEFEQEYWGKFGSTKTINDIKQFISDLRKRDMEALIGIINYLPLYAAPFNMEVVEGVDKNGTRYKLRRENIEQLIKDYYEK